MTQSLTFWVGFQSTIMVHLMTCTGVWETSAITYRHWAFRQMEMMYKTIISPFTLLNRWSARHMFTEFFLGAVLVYLQLTDERAGRWSAAAAILSLVGTCSVLATSSVCFLDFFTLWQENHWIQLSHQLISIYVLYLQAPRFLRFSFQALQDGEWILYYRFSSSSFE